MKALSVMQTWGRTMHTIHSASSLDCSTSLWVLRKALSLSAFPMLGFLSTLCSSQEPSSVRSCQTEIYLAKHTQLHCLPTKGFTQPVMQVTRTRMQGCLLLCSAAAPLVPVQNTAQNISVLYELQTSKHSRYLLSSSTATDVCIPWPDTNQSPTGRQSMGLLGDIAICLPSFFFLSKLPRRGRLDKPLLELAVRVFQHMRIIALKWDFRTCKLEVKSLGANQKKKGLIYTGTARRYECKKRKEEERLGLRNFKNNCLDLIPTAEPWAILQNQSWN